MLDIKPRFVATRFLGPPSRLDDSSGRSGGASLAVKVARRDSAKCPEWVSRGRPWPRAALSILGAVALNFVLATNPRPARYIAP